MSSGLFILLSLHLIVNYELPNKPTFVEKDVLCQDINFIWQKEGYKYIGIMISKKDYLTNYENIDKLQEEIDKKCRK